MWAPVGVPAAPLLFQLLSNDLGQAMEDCPKVGAIVTYVGDLEEASYSWL